MNPNHYLAVASSYLLTHRPHWPVHAAIGKTLVSSSIIDRVVSSDNVVPIGIRVVGKRDPVLVLEADQLRHCVRAGAVHKLGRQLSEVPVGFKWFVPGLFDGS